jgi:hypothetical protein
MKAEHLAIDGSAVTVEADADLTSGASATGWAVVPALMQAHPFSAYPPGYAASAEEALRANFSQAEAITTEEFALKQGKLRVADVRVPTATGGTRELSVGAWEGRSGCLVTSLVGLQRQRLVQVFDTLLFSEQRGGVVIDSPVIARPRAPEVVKEVPGLGILAIRPAIPSELERVPKARGFSADHGELFRVRANRQALLYVGSSTVVSIEPLAGADTQAMVEIAKGLRVEWRPRSTGAAVA